MISLNRCCCSYFQLDKYSYFVLVLAANALLGHKQQGLISEALQVEVVIYSDEGENLIESPRQILIILWLLDGQMDIKMSK